MGNANTKLARWSSSCCCCTTTDGSSPATSSGPPFQVNEVEDLDKMMNYLLLQFKEKNKEQIGSKAIEYASESTTWMRDRVQTCVEWAGQLKSAGTDDICSCTGKVFKEQALAREMGQNLTKVLGEVGKLHWACAGLSLLAYVLTRMDNTSSNYTHCYDVMFRLVDLWWEMIRPLLSEGQGRVKEKVQKGIDLILRGVAYCEMVTHASAAIRFFCLETQQKRLVDFDNEIERFRRETHEILDVKMFVETRVPKSIPSEEMEHAVGLTRRVEAVLKMLNMEEQEKTIAVVLHGMGGIGKSTLADAVDRQVRVSRRCRVLLGHNPSEDRISSLQRTMVEKLTMSSTHSETDAEAVKQRLREVLTEGRDNVSGGSNSKPMFIYIDNVLRKEDLTALLSLDFEHVHLPKGSGLLITTRDMAVCTDVLQRNPEIEVKTYQTELLAKEEAKELLCRHAFQAEQPPHESRYEEMIEDVVTACGFLPLALRVLGRQLYHVLKTNNNHPFEREWKSSIEKLKSGQGNVMNALQYSYDLLQEPDQMAFLLVSTCCVGEEWRRTREIVESLYPLASLATLQDFALVQRYIDHDYEEADVIGRVAMHDLLVTLGHNIAGNRAKVFNNDDDQQNIAWSEIQWLRLNKDIDLDITILDECENLEALFLVKTNFVGSTTKVPLKLKVLDIQREVSWESMWNLDSLGGLVYLACKQCSSFPVSTKLQVLRGYNGDEIPEQVISRQQQLRVLSCPKVVRLTTRFCHDMTKLEVLEIGMAWKDDDIDWPDADFGGLKHLRVLKLRMPGLRTILPSTFNNLRDLQTLHIFCPGLQDLPPLSFSHLSALQHLRILSRKVTSLPDDFAMLADSLETLLLSGQPWKALPPVIWKLTRLHRLILMGMPNLETLQLAAGEPGTCMNSLRALVVLECHSLQELETHSFKSLEFLSIQSATSLKRIFIPQPHMQDSTFLSLRTLLLIECPSLKELPQLGIYRRSLKMLILVDCASLESLPLDTDQIRSNMDNVVVLNCASLKRNLPPESSALPNVIMDLKEDMDEKHIFDISGFAYVMDFHDE